MVVRRLLPPDPYASPRIACPSFDSRQGAKKFNQPLSFDTFGVTKMAAMFHVRSSRALSSIYSRALPWPLRAACAAIVRRFRGFW